MNRAEFRVSRSSFMIDSPTPAETARGASGSRAWSCPVGEFGDICGKTEAGFARSINTLPRQRIRSGRVRPSRFERKKK